MSPDPRTDRPGLVHRLGVAVRFLDAFDGTRVGVPLLVSIPAQRWTALPVPADATYRFALTNRALPAGLFDVAVEVPGGEYAYAEPFKVQLPPPGLPHPPPLTAGDFLVERPLWPTPRFRPPPGETAVLGRVESAGGATSVEGLKVILFVWPGPAPAGPYAYTNDRGDLLFRLPGLKGSASGGTVTATADLGAAVRGAGNAVVPVTPAGSFTVPLGRVSVQRFTVP
jgi:hypothetical protein